MSVEYAIKQMFSEKPLGKYLKFKEKMVMYILE